jgi:hypothetical protein
MTNRAHDDDDDLEGERRKGYGVLLQLVRDHHTHAEEGHYRLRTSHRDLEGRLSVIEAAHNEMALKLTRIEATPAPVPDVLKLTFSPPVVVFIVSTFVAVAGGMWTSTYSLRNDVSNLVNQNMTRDKVDAAQATLQAERSAAMQKAIDSSERTLKLQQIQIQELTNAVLDLKRSRQ